MSFTDTVRNAVNDLNELRYHLDNLPEREIHLRADKIIQRFVPREVVGAYDTVMKDLAGGEFE